MRGTVLTTMATTVCAIVLVAWLASLVVPAIWAAFHLLP